MPLFFLHVYCLWLLTPLQAPGSVPEALQGWYLKQEAFEKCWAHSPLRAAARRCPQQQQRRRQRQRVTERTAMAP